MSSNTETRVCRLVGDILGVPVAGISRATSHEDVPAWDSLNIVKLAMAVEAEFRVHITPDDAVSFTSVQAIIDILARKENQVTR